MAMVKTMTNGEYLRLCQKHGVAPVYLDEKPKRQGRKAKDVFKTTGDGFLLVSPTEIPKPKKTNGKPHNKTPYQLTPYDQKRLAKKAKQPKRKRSRRRRRFDDSALTAVPLRSPMRAPIYTGQLTFVSGGLSALTSSSLLPVRPFAAANPRKSGIVSTSHTITFAPSSQAITNLAIRYTVRVGIAEAMDFEHDRIGAIACRRMVTVSRVHTTGLTHSYAKKIGGTRTLPFSAVVYEAAKRDPTVRIFKDSLLEYGDLRNAIVHDRGKAPVLLADPRDDAVHEIERIWGPPFPVQRLYASLCVRFHFASSP
jgi:hypothetical protein